MFNILKLSKITFIYNVIKLYLDFKYTSFEKSLFDDKTIKLIWIIVDV